MSTSPDRSNPLPLDGATVSGPIYVHLLNSEPDIARVLFFIDPTENDATLEGHAAAGGDPASDAFRRGDVTVPYDLMGGTTAANPWDTTTDPTGNNRVAFDVDGTHTVKVAVLYTDDTTDVFSATLTTNNSPSAVTYPQVPAGLSLSTPSDDMIRVSWTNTATGVGGFDDTVSYEYRYRLSSSAWGSATPTPDGTGGPFDITGLLGGEAYDVQIRGVDADGDVSGWSATASATTTGTSVTPPGSTRTDGATGRSISHATTHGPDFTYVSKPFEAGRNANANNAPKAPPASYGLALLNVAIYDATITAWETKYTYMRPRPIEMDSSLTPIIATPNSPSYPAEHAVAAGCCIRSSCIPVS